MLRTFIGIMAESRVCISLAALLVNVTAIMLCTLAWPLCSNQAMRVVSTRVLPLPAPASTSADCGGQVTAASCSGLRPESRVVFMGAIVAFFSTAQWLFRRPLQKPGR